MRVRLNPEHSLFRRLGRVFDMMEQQDVSIDFVYNRFIVTDTKTGSEFEMLDLEDCGAQPESVSLPPTFEFKLCYDKKEE